MSTLRKIIARMSHIWRAQRQSCLVLAFALSLASFPSGCESPHGERPTRRKPAPEGISDEQWATRFRSFPMGGLMEYGLKTGAETGKIDVNFKKGEQMRFVNGSPQICPSFLPTAFPLEKHDSASWVFYGDEALLNGLASVKYSVDIWRVEGPFFFLSDFAVYPSGYVLTLAFNPVGTEPLRVSATNRGVVVWSGRGTIKNLEDGAIVSVAHPNSVHR